MNLENESEKITDEYYNKISVSDIIHVNEIKMPATDFVNAEQVIKNDGIVEHAAENALKEKNNVFGFAGNVFPIARIKANLPSQNISSSNLTKNKTKTGLYRFCKETDKSESERSSITDEFRKEFGDCKSGLFTEIFSPVLSDIASVKENIISNITKNENEELLMDYVSGIMQKYGAKSFTSTDNMYHPESQKIIKIVEISENIELIGKVCNHISCGYSLNGKIIYPELVSVYKYKKENTNQN